MGVWFLFRCWGLHAGRVGWLGKMNTCVPIKALLELNKILRGFRVLVQ